MNLSRAQILGRLKDYLGGFADAHEIENGYAVTGLGSNYRIEWDVTIEEWIITGENVPVTEVTDLIRIIEGGEISDSERS